MGFAFSAFAPFIGLFREQNHAKAICRTRAPDSGAFLFLALQSHSLIYLLPQNSSFQNSKPKGLS
jgi:hypothetical protein